MVPIVSKDHVALIFLAKSVHQEYQILAILHGLIGNSQLMWYSPSNLKNQSPSDSVSQPTRLESSQQSCKNLKPYTHADSYQIGTVGVLDNEEQQHNEDNHLT
jgi:hypothetical protein